MATTLANRAAMDRTVNVLRFSFNFLRNFSVSSPSSSSTNPTTASASKKPKRKKTKNLFEVAHFLPNWGIGYHMAKTHWTGVSYEITKINLYKDGKHGKAWGIVHKDEDNDSSTVLSSLKILSYNVWFRKDLEMYKRMKALGDLIQLHSPDLICFQEVTPTSYYIFQQSSWWKVYRCSISNETAKLRPYFCMQLSKLPVKSFTRKPFGNSTMGRELCVADIEVQADKSLVVATSHLERYPAPPKWDQMYSKERVTQAKEALNTLKKYPNVIFCGDMNWDDELDGQFPLSEGWVDAWAELRPGENGWTYDTESNQMLSGYRTLQKRLDRFVCNLRDFRITEIDMIGMEAIPGLSYCKEKKVRKEIQKLVLPVFPSDHYGLLLKISSQ